MKTNQTVYTLGALLFSLVFIASGCSSKPAEDPSAQAPASIEAAPVVIAPNEPLILSASTTVPVPPVAKPVGTKAMPRPQTAPLVVAPKLHILRVNIANMAFSPQVIAIKAGDTVQWVNTDTVPHTVTSDGSLLWDSGTIKPGASFERQFKFAGSYPYHCGIHSTMKGTVVIY